MPVCEIDLRHDNLETERRVHSPEGECGRPARLYSRKLYVSALSIFWKAPTGLRPSKCRFIRLFGVLGFVRIRVLGLSTPPRKGASRDPLMLFRVIQARRSKPGDCGVRNA